MIKPTHENVLLAETQQSSQNWLPSCPPYYLQAGVIQNRKIDRSVSAPCNRRGAEYPFLLHTHNRNSNLSLWMPRLIYVFPEHARQFVGICHALANPRRLKTCLLGVVSKLG